eukprot:scaffold457376_cov19-Prasinocladus_malaysianus.AAC.1
MEFPSDSLLMVQAVAPKLSREDELYVISLVDLATRTVGEDAAAVINVSPAFSNGSGTTAI